MRKALIQESAIGYIYQPGLTLTLQWQLSRRQLLSPNFTPQSFREGELVPMLAAEKMLMSR